MIASHMDFLMKKVVAPERKLRPLGMNVDYRLVQDELKKFKPKPECLQVFSRTDEEYRPTYEMIRQNRLPESESMFARALNILFGEGKRGGARRRRSTAANCPSMGRSAPTSARPASAATSEPDGWYLKGFTLTK